MSWRIVVIRGPAKLDLKLGQMMVRQEETTRINLNEMAMLVLENTAISLTACLLSELMERKIKVIFCDSRRNPQSELVPFHGSHDSTGKIRTQIGWTEFIKEQVWTEIVREKIRNQMIYMREQQKPEAELLQLYLQELLPGDSTNREGHAAKVYFNQLMGSTFSRGNEDILLNSGLDYGYAVLRGYIARVCVGYGLNTQLGIHHKSEYNRFNLVDDLMEPFRPIVDLVAYEVLRDAEYFKTEHRRKLVGILNDKMMYRGKKMYLCNVLENYIEQYASLIMGRCEQIVFPDVDEFIGEEVDGL